MQQRDSTRDPLTPEFSASLETAPVQLTPLAQSDAKYHLHSQTNLALHGRKGPLIIVRGDGPYVFDEAGQR